MFDRETDFESRITTPDFSPEDMDVEFTLRPKTLKEYETFFQTVNKCIDQRGKQIANFLMNRENGAESMGKGASTFSFSDLQNAKETFLEYVYSFMSISPWKLKLLGFFLFCIIFSPIMVKLEM